MTRLLTVATCEYGFTCDSGECQPESNVCDQFDDCGDGSDEEQGCGNYSKDGKFKKCTIAHDICTS